MSAPAYFVTSSAIFVHHVEVLSLLLAESLHLGDLLLGECVEIPVLQLVLVHLVESKRVLNVDGDDLALLLAYDEVGVALEELVYGCLTHLSRRNAVAERGIAAAHNVSKTRELRFDAGLLLDALCKALGEVLDALGDDHDEAALTVCLHGLDLLDWRQPRRIPSRG